MASPVNESGLAAALAEAEAAGVLPLTSACNIFCIFCSNRANPPGVRVFALGPRRLAEIERSLAQMGDREEVVIGESASRISEGEPLTHPDFDQIARLVRRYAPRAVLRLTTNGTLLDAGRAALLAGLAPVEITLSLNTASPEAYRRLHGVDRDPCLAPAALAGAGLVFHASVVAVPAVTGPGDLARTVRFLEDLGCVDCRVFVPGFTVCTPTKIRRLLPSREEVARAVGEARQVTRMPLTLEPPDLDDLVPRLAGVLRASPAARAGLEPGDVLETVEGVRPFSRVDAFRRCLGALRRAGRCRLQVSGATGRREVVLEATGAAIPVEEAARTTAPAGFLPPARPGLILDRDVDPADLDLILGLARRLKARRAVVLTSLLAGKVMTLGLAARRAAQTGAPEAVAVAVRSLAFGGSIACAGLLTVPDFASALRGARSAGSAVRPATASASLRPGDAVFLPPVAFDRGGLDLLGRGPAELRELLPPGMRLVVPGLLVL